MTHLMKQLVAHDPTHPKRKFLDPRFSEPEMLFPMDIEAKELQRSSTFSITEIKFRCISLCDPCTIFTSFDVDFLQGKIELHARKR